jgi:L-ribulose-5-phosphate 3-epimerase
MNVGVTGLVLPEAWSFAETLETIKAAGYDSFELALRDSGYFSLESTDSELRAIAAQAKSAGVELVSMCPAIRSQPKDLMCADKEIRRQGVATFEKFIRIAETVGVDTILVVLGSLTPELYYDDAYVNALESMRALAPVAEKAGVKLAIEYVWNKFLLSPVEFAKFCDEVGSPNVGFYFDPGNMAIFSFPEQWVKICGRHLMAVHMKDFRRSDATWPGLLEGDVNFESVMKELRHLGFDGALVSEVDTAAASLEATADSIRKTMDM